MANQNIFRGALLAIIAIGFGVGALRLPIGQFSRPGPGLFPLLVSSLLLVSALLMLMQAFLTAPEPLYFHAKNIAVVLLGLAGFALLSALLSMILGIVWLVFVSSLAGTSYSWKRNLKISIALVAIAFGFQELLGLNLRLM
jgi:hypothetical protein